jgi:hypothetical protein
MRGLEKSKDRKNFFPPLSCSILIAIFNGLQQGERVREGDYTRNESF